VQRELHLGRSAPGGTNPGASACWCTNNNQCASGSCANWSGCAAGVCTGAAGTGGADNCVQVPAPTCVPRPARIRALSASREDATRRNTCQCTTDAQCGTAASACPGPDALRALARARGRLAATAASSRRSPSHRHALRPSILVHRGSIATRRARRASAPQTTSVRAASASTRGQGCQMLNGVNQCSGAGTPRRVGVRAANINNCTSKPTAGGFAGTSVEACAGGGSGTPGLGQCNCTASTNCGSRHDHASAGRLHPGAARTRSALTRPTRRRAAAAWVR